MLTPTQERWAEALQVEKMVMDDGVVFFEIGFNDTPADADVARSEAARVFEELKRRYPDSVWHTDLSCVDRPGLD